MSMIELEIDGRKIEVPAGSMVMDAATKLGLYVPHFCYHKKLSIAANCRMCLVEVEKAPKALPACATPVTAGMKVFTASDKARQAQKSVMEFLLINHPLDCPICDQGGECQLQDLAVGYGPSSSQFSETKRVVFHKPMGPLISAQEMSRCIHCTRCVRFGQEIAGLMELGMAGRGEHSEIMSFVGQAVEHELSGNMIDVCPVGALTSKPFRYQARTWELARRRSVSPHDSVGANVTLQVKSGRVLRVVPFENESVNECWISDRDRFAYEGLSSPDRLRVPMLRNPDGSWREVEWGEALSEAARVLKSASGRGANRIRSLASPISTLEELALLSRLTRGMQSDAVDCRPHLSESGFDARVSGVPTLGRSLESFSSIQRLFVVGASLRSESPLLAQRIRQATKRGAEVHRLHAYAERLLMPVKETLVAAPSQWLEELRAMVAIAQSGDSAKKTGADAERARIVSSLASAPSGSEKAHILAGAAVLSHPNASLILAELKSLADVLGIGYGVIPIGANGAGGPLAGAIPQLGGPNAHDFFLDGAAAFLTLHLEPALDLSDAPRAVSALKVAQTGLGVVALTSYRSAVESVASIMLPVAPFSETSGSFVNAEGRLQSFQGAVPPLGQARPAWKVLRVLGNLLDLSDFDYESSEAVLQSLVGDLASGQCIDGLGLRPAGGSASPVVHDPRLFERLGETPIFMSDPILRRSDCLLQTRQSADPEVVLHPDDLEALGGSVSTPIELRSGGNRLVLMPRCDPTQARGVVRVAVGHPSSASLNNRFGWVEVSLATASMAA